MDSDIAAYIIQTAWRSYQGRKCESLAKMNASQSHNLLSIDEEDTHPTLATSGYMTTSISSCFSDLKTSNSFSDYRVSASTTEDNLDAIEDSAESLERSGSQKTLLSGGDTPRHKCVDKIKDPRSRESSLLKEADSLSIMSDCSELMGEVGKLLKAQLTAKDPFLKPNVVRRPIHSGVREHASPLRTDLREHEEEIEENCPKELRKANYLSLAQEFAALKSQDASVLPFNLHEYHDPTSDVSSRESSPADDFRLVPVSLGNSFSTVMLGMDSPSCSNEDVRLEQLFQETTLQEPNWGLLEKKLREAESEESFRQAGLTERERVLQSLSMTYDDEDFCLPDRRPSLGMEVCFRNDAASDSESSSEFESDQQWQRFKRPPQNYIPKMSELTKPMQLCFINDLTSDEEEPSSTRSSGTLVTDSGIGDPSFRSQTRRPLEPELLDSITNSSSITTIGSEDDDLLSRQAKLQAEAHLALAQAKPMAQMQLEVEKHQQQQADRDLVQELTGLGRGRRLKPSFLYEMNFGALQLIYNELLSKIEVYNEELVTSLIDRDDLHMEQDSMLVEVEDLTRRAQEIASKLNESPNAQKKQVANGAAKSDKTSPVKRRMSSFTAKLKPNKLVSLFTGSSLTSS